jgi:hypothetical protein
MKRLFAIFVLKPAEQRLVIFVMLLLIAGAWLKHHRDLNYSVPAPNAILPSPADQ